MPVGKPFNYCAHGWQGFAEGVLRVVLLMVFIFQVITVEKHSASKISQGIWERLLYDNYSSKLFMKASQENIRPC